MATTAEPITYRRGRRKTGPTHDYMIWVSHCGTYRVFHARPLLAGGKNYFGSEALASEAAGRWVPIAYRYKKNGPREKRTYGTRASAEKAIERHRRGYRD